MIIFIITHYIISEIYTSLWKFKHLLTFTLEFSVQSGTGILSNWQNYNPNIPYMQVLQFPIREIPTGKENIQYSLCG